MPNNQQQKSQQIPVLGPSPVRPHWKLSQPIPGSVRDAREVDIRPVSVTQAARWKSRLRIPPDIGTILGVERTHYLSLVECRSQCCRIPPHSSRLEAVFRTLNFQEQKLPEHSLHFLRSPGHERCHTFQGFDQQTKNVGDTNAL